LEYILLSLVVNISSTRVLEMNLSEVQILDQLNTRRKNNLAFFKGAYPELYEYFKDYKLENARLNILTEEDEMDLWVGDKSTYNNRAKAYAKEEVAHFKEAFNEGQRIISVNCPLPGEYSNPRFFARYADKIIHKSPITRDNFMYYKLADFYPCIAFLGVGLGYHIEEFVTNNQVNVAYIVEPDLDKFAASLYTADWEKICADMNPSEGRAIHFLVGKTEGGEEEFVLWAVLWNNLVANSPSFPLATLFYNHQANEMFDRISDKVNDDMYVFLMSWGNYDDELNQLNQCLHNLKMGCKLIPPFKKGFEDVPVCIIGAGPSLDERIDYLKEIKDEVIIISCGSSLKSLYVNGITPDMHIELESDFLNVDYLRQIKDDDWVRSLNMIGPSHLNPCVFEWFENLRIYFKKESGISNMFGNDDDTIADGTPTCTNLALAIASHYRFNSIYLFGMDFAFPSKERHHAKGSPYYDTDQLDTVLQDVTAVENYHMFDVEGVDGRTLLTTPPYYTALRKVEHLIRHAKLIKDNKTKVYSCSDGAKIVGASWIQESEFKQQVASSTQSDKKSFMNYLFGDECREISQAAIDHQIDILVHTMDEFTSDAKKMVQEEILSLDDVSRICFRLNAYMEKVVGKRVEGFYFLMRGSLRHFTYILFGHAFAIDDEERRLEFIKEWQLDVVEFLENVGPHFKKILLKDFDFHTDPWVRMSITDPEEE